MGKFDKILWLGSKNRFVQLTNYFRWKNYKTWSIAKYIQKGNYAVLDVGCSSGELISFTHKSKGSKGYGLDISKIAIREARKRHPECTFTLGSAEAPPFSNNTFDYIICYDLLEHVNHPERAVKEFARILKPNGKLILQYETADRYSEKLRDLDRKNHTKNSWIHGEKFLPVVRKHFKVERSFYGGQLFAFYPSMRILEILYHIPGFFAPYAILELWLSVILGKYVKGTWMFIHGTKK